MFATAQLGAVFVPLNTRLAPPELAYVLEHSGSRLLLAEDALAEALEDPALSGLGLESHVFTRRRAPAWTTCSPTCPRSLRRSTSRSGSTTSSWCSTPRAPPGARRAWC